MPKKIELPKIELSDEFRAKLKRIASDESKSLRQVTKEALRGLIEEYEEDALAN